MPKYNMKCPDCGHNETHEMSITGYINSEIKCGQCGTVMARKFALEDSPMVSVVGVSKGNYNSNDRSR